MLMLMLQKNIGIDVNYRKENQNIKTWTLKNRYGAVLKSLNQKVALSLFLDRAHSMRSRRVTYFLQTFILNFIMFRFFWTQPELIYGYLRRL